MGVKVAFNNPFDAKVHLGGGFPGLLRTVGPLNILRLHKTSLMGEADASPGYVLQRIYRTERENGMSSSNVSAWFAKVFNSLKGLSHKN